MATASEVATILFGKARPRNALHLDSLDKMTLVRLPFLFSNFAAMGSAASWGDLQSGGSIARWEEASR